jgi:hypothetical protein
MINNEKWILVAQQLAKVQSLRKKYELEESKKLLQNNESYEEGRFSFALEVRKGTIKYDQIPELKNIDLEQYRGPNIDSWRFKVLY